MHLRAVFLIPAILLLPASPARAEGDAPREEREICAPARVSLSDGGIIRADRVIVAGDSLRVFTDIEMRLSSPVPFSPAPVPIRRTIPLSRVTAVACPDPLSNGALTGFLIGGIPLAIVSALATAASNEHVSGLAILGAAGMGMGVGGTAGGITGALIDASFVRRLRPADLLEEGARGDRTPTGRVERAPAD